MQSGFHSAGHICQHFSHVYRVEGLHLYQPKKTVSDRKWPLMYVQGVIL